MKDSIEAPGAPGLRSSRAWLVGKSVLALLWFAFVFFVSFPSLVLWWSGHDWTIGANPAVALGAVLVGCGALVVLLPTVSFVRDARGTPFPWDPPRAFVVHGLFRWVRNPMYLAYQGIIIGEALVFESITLGVYAVGFCGLAHAYVTRIEEKELHRRFGESYRSYCAVVPRWIPRRPS